MATLPPRAAPVVIAAVALAPLLALALPHASTRGAVIGVALAVLAGLHGLGRLVAWLADDDDAPLALVLVWGIAAYLALAGILIALHGFGPAARTGVLVAGGVLGAGWLARNAPRILDGARAGVTPTTVVVGALVVAILSVVVLAEAGNWHGPFQDGETGYLGQLRRLDDTGGLDDAIGFPRAAGLGGQVALAAIAAPLDLRASHIVDRGILFALVVLLGVTAVRRRRGATTAAALILPAALLAIPEYPNDMAPHWSLLVLILGAALSLDRARDTGSRGSAVLVILTLAAAVTLRHAAIPFSIVMTAALIRNRRELWRPVAVVGAVVILPWVIALVRARTSGHDAAFGTELSATAGARIGLWLAAAGGAALLAALAIPRSLAAFRTAVLAACASAATAGLLSPSWDAAWQVALPLGIAIVVLVGLTLIGEPATTDDHPRRPPFAAAVIAASVVVGILPMTRFAVGRPLLGYQTRMAKMLQDARAVGGIPRAERTLVAADYAAAQATIPAGARIGIWVDRADLVRYDTHAVTDLRTPAAQACLAQTGEHLSRPCEQIELAIDHLALRYILLSIPALPPTDPLARFPAGVHRYEDGGLVVIELAGG